MPIISYGLVVVRYNSSNAGFEYLMIRRKDSYGYIDFIRGKYHPQNIRQVAQIIRQMSLFEKQQILNHPFSFLWRQMWGHILNKSQQRAEEAFAERKYNAIRHGFYRYDTLITLKHLIETDDSKWDETEWEFPKGRRELNERDLDCAVREFEEETGILKTNIQVIENLFPFEETFIGTNYKSYKNKYFLAFFSESTQDFENFQKSEVSKMEWKSFEDCIASIRPYNNEKKHIVYNIQSILNESFLHLQ